MPAPDVSVIIGAYNAMPYLTRCVDSVITQSIGTERLELIAVDDGSTDGTGTELDRFAAAHPGTVRVVHQENSGGPGGPRNVGLDLARGRYVFFLDADDYLGPQALERMVAMADEQGSDVVLGKMVGVGGRSAPRLAYTEHRTRATVFDSKVYWNLTIMKLFRRELIERLGLRFMTELKLRQDQPFCAMAYIHAANISVITDYDCVYWVFRDDGANITRRIRGTEYRVKALAVMCELLGREVPAGAQRDRLMYRHLVTELRATLQCLCEEEMEEAERERLFGELKRLLNSWHSEALAQRLPAVRRLHYELVRRGTLAQLFEAREFVAKQVIRNGDDKLRNGQSLLPPKVVVEDGRAYADYLFFRDPRGALPDEVFDYTDEVRAAHRLDDVSVRGTRLQVTGWAGLPRVEGEARIDAVLRERTSRSEHVVPATAVGDADGSDFSFTVDVATAAGGRPLPDGLWDLFLELSVNGLRRRVRIGGSRAERVDPRPFLHALPAGGGRAAPTTFAVYYTARHGNLSLDVGGAKHQPLRGAVCRSAEWAPGPAPVLRVSGALAHRYAEDAVRLTASNGTDTFDVPVVPAQHDGEFQTDLALSPKPGAWTITLDWFGGEGIAVVPAAPLAPRRWFHRGLPWYAKPSADAEELVVVVDRVELRRALARRLRGLGMKK